MSYISRICFVFFLVVQFPRFIRAEEPSSTPTVAVPIPTPTSTPTAELHKVKAVKSIKYGKGGKVKLLLDLWKPLDVDQPVPGLIFIHGGGWKGGKREDMNEYAQYFAERGYVTATISYRLIPQGPFPAPVEDAKCAVRWMKVKGKEYGVDPERIAVAGQSAGGHLAMMVGYTSDLPQLEGEGGNPKVGSSVQAVVNFYGPSDLTPILVRDSRLVQEFLGGKKFEEVPDLYNLASPIKHLTKDDPPTLILHGTADWVVPIDQSDALAEGLKNLEIPYTYKRVKNRSHVMDKEPAVRDICLKAMSEFFEKYLAKR